MPFQDGRKLFHHRMSALASELRWIRWWSLLTVVERWIRQCRSRRPASKVFEDAGSRANTKGEAGVNVVLLSPHSDQRGGRCQCSTALTTFRGLD